MNKKADCRRESLTGVCACGTIRYRLNSVPSDGVYCHCTICRRSAGASVLAFATLRRGSFVVTEGSLAIWRSSDFAWRGFCEDCGTQLTMSVEHQRDTIDFTLASLDCPERVTPGYHIWFGSRIAWFDTDDSTPRHEKLRPETRGWADRYRNGA